MTEAAERRERIGAADGWRAFGIFCAVSLGVFALYAASAWLFADLSALDRSGGARLARFNAALGLVLAYVCAALWLGRRWMQRDVVELHGLVEASAAQWASWTERVRAGTVSSLVRAALAGAVLGAAVVWIGGRVSEPEPSAWQGHAVWVRILNPALFAAMGLLAWVNSQRARVYWELGRHARVRVGEVEPLAIFVRAGLRVALLWFLGTSLGCLLLVDTDTPLLVIPVLVATTAIAVASLLAPSRGVHERMREAKRAELTWLRAAIARASDALRRGDAAGAAQLPALLAWETRVAGASEWPFDTSTWLRFALLLLVPLGSWLGGALVEHVVDRWLG
jgi:hypothetical protein